MDYVKSMLIDIFRIKKYDDKTIIETLINLLKIADNLLKYVSEFVKKALQVKYLILIGYFYMYICKIFELYIG
jgi:hypothetical protein